MGKVRWTGHPFVDAGLAAIAAITKVRQLEDLTEEHLQKAADELQRILLSDQSLGLDHPKSFVRGPLSQLFPNSELVNPSNWKGKTKEEKAEKVRKKFRDAIQLDLKGALFCFRKEEVDFVCSVCGGGRPTETMVTVRKDKMPLLEGIVNFYPAFAYGVRICALCALAVRFLPLSVMRTGVYNRLWFLHTQALPIAAAIAEHYGWRYFNESIARNEAIDFFSRWQTAGDAATVLYLVCELLDQLGDEMRAVYQSPLPTAAYLFTNDNRGSYVRTLTIPNELLSFFAKLQVWSPKAFRRFWQELLQVFDGLTDKKRKDRITFVQSIAQDLLNGDAIIHRCLDHDAPKLTGGWLGHRLYLREVRNMMAGKLAVLERLGLTIAQSGDARKLITELRTAKWNELYGVLLSYVRRGWLRHDEFYALLPPSEYTSASEVRDILLAVIYEWYHCQEQGEEYPVFGEGAVLASDETLSRIQQIGQQLLARLPNLSRWIGRLQTARSSDRLRGTYLNAVRNGAMHFTDFVFLAPLGDRQRLWLLRDYLLAFLFDCAREALPEEEEIAVGAEVSTETETFHGGEG